MEDEKRMQKNLGHESEHVQSLIVYKPAGADLFFEGRLNNILPETVRLHPTLKNEAHLRQSLITQFDAINKHIPDVTMPWDTAVHNQLLSPQEVTDFYNNLTSFFASDKENARLILYLPLELLPDVRTHKTISNDWDAASEQFRDRYMESWRSLLTESDLQRSFIDGDLPEAEIRVGPLPRLRKAAHLAPFLVQKGYLTENEINSYIKQTKDRELSDSFTTILPMLADLKSKTTEEKTEVFNESQSMEELVAELEEELEAHRQKYAEGSAHIAKMVPMRIKWEKADSRMKLLTRYGARISDLIVSGDLHHQQVIDLACDKKFDNALGFVALSGVVSAIEQVGTNNQTQGLELINDYEQFLRNQWKNGTVEAKDVIVSGVNHWVRLGIIPDDHAQELGIAIPDLSSPTPVDVDSLMKTRCQALQEVVKNIKEDPEVAKTIFPGFLIFGSRLKGYATIQSDIDAAVFIRPEVQWSERENVLRSLQKILTESGVTGEILEFWIGEQKGKYALRHLPKGERTVLGIDQIQFLFGGAWLGENQEMLKLYNDIFMDYVDLSRYGDAAENARFVLLRTLERDIVQYRLMHKGYAHFYPNKRGKGSVQASGIDWESDFWDPGYRQVATKLFFSRVFLPDLSN